MMEDMKSQMKQLTSTLPPINVHKDDDDGFDEDDEQETAQETINKMRQRDIPKDHSIVPSFSPSSDAVKRRSND
jgi:hypothetical protein